jgi:glycosyltransferase involved in cell wall biosynthesis
MKLWRHWRKVFNLIVANSEATKHRLIADGIEPVETVWCSVPLQLQRPPLSAPPTAAFAGRLVQEKGLDVLLHAFRKVVIQIPDAQLLIAGDGPERERLKKLIADLELSSNISMLGHQSRSDIERLFAKAWVQAVPSRWAEPFGLVAAEAMMRGTVVVASDSGGLSEIIQHGRTGFLVPPGDIEALAEALSLLLQDRGLAEQMGKAGREFALAQFNEKTYVDEFVQFYQSICLKY